MYPHAKVDDMTGSPTSGNHSLTRHTNILKLAECLALLGKQALAVVGHQYILG